MKITKLDLFLLSTNLLVLGGLLVLIILTGPDVPRVLLTIGAAGMAIAKLSKALSAGAS